jgi:hypothetical protein
MEYSFPKLAPVMRRGDTSHDCVEFTSSGGNTSPKKIGLPEGQWLKRKNRRFSLSKMLTTFRVAARFTLHTTFGKDKHVGAGWTDGRIA